jgi:hypothetical protein
MANQTEALPGIGRGLLLDLLMEDFLLLRRIGHRLLRDDGRSD